jgi:hypothetical protein
LPPLQVAPSAVALAIWDREHGNSTTVVEHYQLLVEGWAQ